MHRSLLIGFLQCATGSTNTCSPHWLQQFLTVSQSSSNHLSFPFIRLSASQYLLNCLTFLFPAVTFFRCGGRYSFDIQDSLFDIRHSIFLHSIFIIRCSLFVIRYSVFDIRYSVSSFSLILLCSNHITVLGVIISLISHLDILRFWGSVCHFGDSAILILWDCSFGLQCSRSEIALSSCVWHMRVHE